MIRYPDESTHEFAMSPRAAVSVLLALAVGVGCATRPAAPGLPAARGLPQAGEQPRGQSPALALLVGINEYAQPSRGRVPALTGAENDVRLASRMLVERFDFRPEDVLTLTGEQATHAAIVQAFDEHLIQRAGEGTKVVFWFSGHGSRTADLSGVETSKTKQIGAGAYDNTMLAYDSRARELDGSFDFSDDELHSLLRALTERTDQVLVVTDCCHSSGATRGDGDALGTRAANSGSRGVSLARLGALWPADIDYYDDDDAAEFDELPYVHIAACEDYQEAGEIEIDGEKYGTMTWFLVQALEVVRADESWRTLIERVRTRVAGYGNRPGQIISGAGALDRLVFQSDEAAPLPGFRVDRRTGTLRIAAGRAHGLAADAVFDIVSLGDGSKRGEATAKVISASWTIAQWTEGGEPDSATDVLRAVPQSVAMGMAPLRLLVEDELDVAALDGMPWAVVCDARDAEYRLRRTEAGAELTDMQGRRLRPVPLAPAAMREAVFREYTFRGLWESVAQRSEWPIELTVEPADEAAVALAAQRGFELATVQAAAADNRAVRVLAAPMSATSGGALLTLRVENGTDMDLRLTVLSLSEDRAVNIVWPPRDEPDRVLRAEQSQAVTVLVGPSADWPEGRPMIDRYLAIATREPADFRAFTSTAPVWSPTRGGPPAVPSFLKTLLAAERTRGSDDYEADFGLSWCDLQLSPPAAADATPVGR